jgi:hypothetical protein
MIMTPHLNTELELAVAVSLLTNYVHTPADIHLQRWEDICVMRRSDMCISSSKHVAVFIAQAFFLSDWMA